MTDPNDIFERAAAYFFGLQERIVDALDALDGEHTFRHDVWERTEAEATGPVLGGNGRTCVIEEGRVLEKGGVAFSKVHGKFSEDYARTFPGDGRAFRATGVSLVLHPRSPHIPTVHMNYRRLQRGADGWFGGGADLTPYYLDEEDARHFHRVLKAACDAHPEVADFADFKQQCDAYFRNHHRGEARGIGGIFFDHLQGNEEETFDFVRRAGDAFLDAWLPIAVRHAEDAVHEDERAWQLVRRGRYVEFNLVHDRGTLFGLKTGGRIESILMSLPNLVQWRYDHRPAPGSRESQLLDVLVTPRDWT
jgi:coproporphyrinogen III oxidase